MITIGIPRALSYYQYFPMWQTFCRELGLEVVVSPPTTRDMLAAGSARVVADTCLPVKVFLGHIISLVGKCDYVFVPAIRSVDNKVYNCSKFLGLPDMTRAVVPEAPPILEIEIDINRGRAELYQEIYRLGRQFNPNPLKIRQASLAAWQTYLDYQELMFRHKLSAVEAIAKISGVHQSKPATTKPHAARAQTAIALIGHPYLINDEYINHRLIQRLEKTGNRVLTAEMAPGSELKAAMVNLTGGAYWTCEEEVVGGGGYYLQNEADGVIGIMAFGCGPDSLMMDVVRRQAARLKKTPFMCLTMEEHTAEAGIITRLEAFTDMLHRKKGLKVAECA